MPTPIDRDEVRRLLAEGAQLVDVLPQAEYEDEHIAGAIDIPLKTLDAETTRLLDRERPVIVYCHDYQRDMSPRAAARLASIGFTRVYDYVAGKADWGAAGLPLEGENGSQTRAGGHVRRDVPTCRLGDALADVRTRVQDAGWDTCFVVDEEGVVLGRIGRRALGGDAGVSVEQAMTPGPSTIRPSARLAAAVERMRKQKLASLPVTTSDGGLVGLLMLEDAEGALAARDQTPD